MSHHFDTPTAVEDPRINVCDFYLFRGRPGTTVMALTVNPDAGLSAPESFRDEAIYAFRFDLNGDAKEELVFKVRFEVVKNSDSEAHIHEQKLVIYRAAGRPAAKGLGGSIILSGVTNEIVDMGNGVRAFAGLAPDLFAGNAAALGAFRAVFFGEGRFDAEPFKHRVNFFARRNVNAIILEVPSKLIGRGVVHGWATASVCVHAQEVQVSRWGLPLITNIFMPDMAMREAYNRGQPKDDQAQFADQIGGVIKTLTTLAGSVSDPDDYAGHVVGRLCPALLPYELGTVAAFDCDGFNGRPLTDDAMDIIMRLATNMSLVGGIAPDRARTREVFPYFGAPYSIAEQAGVAPARPAPERK
jgi:hypothetical protein